MHLHLTSLLQSGHLAKVMFMVAEEESRLLLSATLTLVTPKWRSFQLSWPHYGHKRSKFTSSTGAEINDLIVSRWIQGLLSLVGVRKMEVTVQILVVDVMEWRTLLNIHIPASSQASGMCLPGNLICILIIVCMYQTDFDDLEFLLLCVPVCVSRVESRWILVLRLITTEAKLNDSSIKFSTKKID